MPALPGDQPLPGLGARGRSPRKRAQGNEHRIAVVDEYYAVSVAKIGKRMRCTLIVRDRSGRVVPHLLWEETPEGRITTRMLLRTLLHAARTAAYRQENDML